jgi:hypothetical protein
MKSVTGERESAKRTLKERQAFLIGSSLHKIFLDSLSKIGLTNGINVIPKPLQL